MRGPASAGQRGQECGHAPLRWASYPVWLIVCRVVSLRSDSNNSPTPVGARIWFGSMVPYSQVICRTQMCHTKWSTNTSFLRFWDWDLPSPRQFMQTQSLTSPNMRQGKDRLVVMLQRRLAHWASVRLTSISTNRLLLSTAQRV